MESSIWTTTGTTLSPMFNPFCEFAKKDAVSFFGVQLPSRGMRRKEPHPGTIQEAARQAMEAIRPLIARCKCPYAFVGYSMGSWLAYEVTCLAKKEGLPLPLHLIAAAMVSPNLPRKLRPWKCTSALDTEGFQGWFEVLGQAKSEKPNAIIPIEGDHGLVFDAAKRQAFFERIVEILDSLLLEIEYGQ
ncbi:hypothetical protein Emag_004946 [Eimeria magna]